MAAPTGPEAVTAPAEWSTWRYADLICLLAPLLAPGARLVDLGCGNGNTLEHLRATLPVGPLLAVDADAAVAARAGARLACPALAASVLDREALAPHRGAFDLAVVGDLLHHLAGRSRRESLHLAGEAIAAATGLLAPGGWLAVLEPTFRPRFVATAALHLKRAMARFRGGRMEIGAAWLNLGPPVVCLHTAADLGALVAARPELDLVASWARETERACGLRRGRVTLLARRL